MLAARVEQAARLRTYRPPLGHRHRVLRGHGSLQPSLSGRPASRSDTRPNASQKLRTPFCCVPPFSAESNAMNHARSRRRRSIGPPPLCRSCSPSPGSDGFRSASSGPQSGRYLPTPIAGLVLLAAGCRACRNEAGAVHCTKQPSIKDSIADLNWPAKANWQRIGRPAKFPVGCGCFWNCVTLSGRSPLPCPRNRHACQAPPPLWNLALAGHRRACCPRQPPVRHGAGVRRGRLLERSPARGAGAPGDRALRAGWPARRRFAQALFRPLEGA